MTAGASAEAPSDGGQVFHVHTAMPDQETRTGTTLPAYTSGGGNQGASVGSEESKQKYVNDDNELGFKPGRTTCFTCRQQVMTYVTYKAGKFAWAMLLVFFILGFFTCLATWFLMPIVLLKKLKDAHHICPHCNTVLHIEKRQCCK